MAKKFDVYEGYTNEQLVEALRVYSIQSNNTGNELKYNLVKDEILRRMGSNGTDNK